MPQHHDHQQQTTVEQLQADLRCIALALDASHGAVATDLPDAKPNETHWRIDHTQEQAALARIAEVLMLNYESGMLAKTLEGERLVVGERTRHHLHSALEEAATEQARYLFKVCLSDAQQGAHPLPAKETQMLRQLLAAEHLLAQLIDEATACLQSAPRQAES